MMSALLMSSGEKTIEAYTSIQVGIFTYMLLFVHILHIISRNYLLVSNERDSNNKVIFLTSR